MSYRCCQCGAELPSKAAWESNRDRPMACASCGTRQYAAVGVLGKFILAISLVVGMGLMLTAADAIAAWLGVHALPVGLSLLLLPIVATAAFIARRGRMRPWVHSRKRAIAWFVYQIVVTAIVIGFAIVIVRGGDPGPLATIDGTVTEVSAGGFVCLQLEGRPDRFRIGEDIVRRRLGGHVPPTLQRGARVRLWVPEADLAEPGDEPFRRVLGLAIAGQEVVAADTVTRGRRREANGLGAMLGLVVVLYLWLTWRQYRALRAEPPA